MNGKFFDAYLGKNLGQHIGGGCNKFYLCKTAVVSENIDITLGKLAETSLLGVIGTPNTAYLKRLEGGGKLFLVGGIVSCQRNGEVVTHAAVGKFLLARFDGACKLGTALHYLEDELFIVAALLGGEVLDMFHAGCLYLHKAIHGVAFLYHAKNMLTHSHVGRKHVAHSLDGGFNEFQFSHSL